MQDVFPSPEAMNAAHALLHEFRALSESTPFFARQKAEEKLVHELISFGVTPIHDAASHDGPLELFAVHGATMGEESQQAA